MYLRASVFIAVILVVFSAVCASPAHAAPDSWSFSQSWDSYYNGYYFYSHYSPWSSTSTYNSSYGAFASDYRYRTYRNCCAITYNTSSGSSYEYDFYLNYQFSSPTGAPGQLSFYYTYQDSEFYFYYSSDGSNWQKTTFSSYNSTSDDRTDWTLFQIDIPAGTRYLRWHSKPNDAERYDGVYLDDVSFQIYKSWATDITGYTEGAVNSGTLELSASVSSISGYTPSEVRWYYQTSSSNSWTHFATDNSSSGGWNASLDTVAYNLNDTNLKISAEPYVPGYSRYRYFEEVDVQNVSVSNLSFGGDPISGDTTISFDASLPSNMTASEPNSTWGYRGSATYNYTYTTMINRTYPLEYSGTLTGITTNFSSVYSTSTSYYFYFHLWRHNGSSSFTRVAVSNRLYYSTGARNYTMSGSQWTNLPSGLHYGAYLYRGYVYRSSTSPYYLSDHRADAEYYVYSSDRSGTQSYWYGPYTQYALPIDTHWQLNPTSIDGVKLRYTVPGQSPVEIGEMTGNNGTYSYDWASWAVDAQNVLFEVSYDRDGWGDWVELGTRDVSNRLNITLRTQLGPDVPGPGTLIMDGLSGDSPFTAEFTYYQTFQIEAPEYIYQGEYRWEWRSWSDDGDRIHSITTQPHMEQYLTAIYARQYYFEVVSERAAYSAEPDGWYDEGTVVSIEADEVDVVVAGQERYRYAGYEAFAFSDSGTSVAISFELDRNLTVELSWVLQYYYDVTGDRSTLQGDRPGWYDEGASVHSYIAEALPNGRNSRLQADGYLLDGNRVEATNTLTFEIVRYTAVEWFWMQQHFVECVTNAGTISPEDGWYDEGALLTVDATPPASGALVRYTFTEWVGSGDGSVTRTGGAPSAEITVNAPIVQTAVWLIEYYLETLSALGTFESDPEGWYVAGTDVDITAVEPAVQTGSRYVPQWLSPDVNGINAGPSFDTPHTFTVTMDGWVRQTVDWALQHSLVITSEMADADMQPDIGTHWYFEGEDIIGHCRFLYSYEVVCGGYTATGSLSDDDLPYFRTTITSPTTLNWTFRDRETLPSFGPGLIEEFDSKGPVAFDYNENGEPVIAYMDKQNNLLVAVFDGSAWNKRIVASDVLPFEYISLAAAGNGHYLIVLDDKSTHNTVLYPVTDNARVPASGISPVLVRYDGDSAINTNCAYDPVSGHVFASAFSASGELLFMDFSEEYELLETEVVTDIGLPGIYSDIVVNPLTGLVTIVFHDAFDRKFKAAHRTEDGWDIELVDDSGAVGVDCRAVIDRSGLLYVAYRDSTYYDKSFLKLAVMDETGWQIYTLDEVGSVGRGLSIRLGSDDYPHIMYYGENSLKLLRFLGETWQIFTVFTGIEPKGRTNVVLGADSRPIYYYNDGDGFKMGYATEGNLVPDNVESDSSNTNVAGDGAPTGGGGGGGCFVATAAFGSLAGETVSSLTAVRDGTFLASATGSSLVDCYYAVSPAVARFFEPAFSAIVREMLN
ncbi:MAG: CFI-box-CTERM domain-containing protein [Planctomycetota bacterium]|nr:CFI-box-CTERM domain-containing protein [Planctomycetota bacterium]